MHIDDRAVLNDGNAMPWLGLGVYLVKDGKEAQQTVAWAVEAGYRLIDTASFYRNEAGVAQGLSACGVPREEIFLTTKVWNSEQGYDSTMTAFENSLRRLNTDYLDLYLIHWPGPDSTRRLKTFEALLELRRKGRVKSIGVSNFKIHHLEELIKTFGEAPAVDQVELHPFFPQTELRQFAKEKKIAITAWGPLFHGHIKEAPGLDAIGEKYGKTGAQAVLRWHLQNGVAIIPKSIKKERIQENADIFDFTLSDEDMRKIDALNTNTSFGADPDIFTMGF